MDIEPRFNASSDVNFRLFTRSNPTAPQVINIFNDAELANSNFNPTHQTRFTIHGNTVINNFYFSYKFILFLGWNFGGPLAGAFLRNAFLERGDFNVFTVDWGT